MAKCSGQGQGEQQWQLGVEIVTDLYMSFNQGEAEQKDKLDAKSHMATCLY
jgi:hypothetical protein